MELAILKNGRGMAEENGRKVVAAAVNGGSGKCNDDIETYDDFRWTSVLTGGAEGRVGPRRLEGHRTVDHQSKQFLKATAIPSAYIFSAHDVRILTISSFFTYFF